MKVAFVLKLSKQISNHEMVKEVLLEDRHNRRIYLEKSVKLTRPVFEVWGTDGDDYTNNRLTVLMSYNGIKIPRFVKNHLLKLFLYNKSHTHNRSFKV